MCIDGYEIHTVSLDTLKLCLWTYYSMFCIQYTQVHYIRLLKRTTIGVANILSFFSMKCRRYFLSTGSINIYAQKINGKKKVF